MNSIGIKKEEYKYFYEYESTSAHFKVKIFKKGPYINLEGIKIQSDNFLVNFSKHKSNEPNNEYVLTILSSTNNPNVIFELTLRDKYPKDEYDELINTIKEYM